MVKTTAAKGAMLLFKLSHSTKINTREVDTPMFTSCVKGNCKNFARVGFTLYVKYVFKKKEITRLMINPIICDSI